MWFGLVWCGPPVMDQRPALGNVLWPSTSDFTSGEVIPEKNCKKKPYSSHFNMAPIINKYWLKKELQAHVCAPV